MTQSFFPEQMKSESLAGRTYPLAFKFLISSFKLSTCLCSGWFVWFGPHCSACGILVPRPGIEPVPPAVEARSLNHWTTREVPVWWLFFINRFPFYR